MTAPTVVVTGASSGIGAAAARRLHAEGAELVLLGRDPRRTSQIGAELGVPALTADFADLTTVVRAAERVRDITSTVDVMLSNAGGASSSPRPTVDGNEVNLQVNALAPLLLETLLMPALRNAHEARLIATTSGSHRATTLTAGRVDAELQTVTGLRSHDRYARAKLVGLIVHEEWRRRRLDGVALVDVHPGLVASDFGRYMGRVGNVLKVLATPFLSSPEAAAARLLRPALERERDHRYYHRETPRDPAALVEDAALGSEVWRFVRGRLHPWLPDL